MQASDSAPPGSFDINRYIGHFQKMLQIRAFEKAALTGLEQGLIHGAIHPSIGQEAVAAGICSNLATRDILLSNHRGHGHTLAKGADAGAMMRELFGRAGGTCNGKGGSMHIADFSVGMLGANGVVGANITIAAGAAHAITLTGEDRIVACIFGDGAINRGPFLEGLNWAKIYNLPVLFVCEDNGFAATTRTASLTAGTGPAARAASLGLITREIDGNDIVEVDEAARELIAAIRQGKGPHFLVAKTYRLTGHTAADAGSYRTQDEVASHWQQDPIARCRALLQEHAVTEAQLEAWQTAATQQIEAVYVSAKDAPWPRATNAYRDVQDIGDPTRRMF